MEVTMNAMAVEDYSNTYSGYSAFTISANNHRIYTVVTESAKIAGKWLTEALKVYNHHRRPTNHSAKRRETIVVGFSVDKPHPEFFNEYPYGEFDTWYNLYIVCIGAQCLVFSPGGRRYPKYRPEAASQEFNAFFSDPRVVAVGFNMKEVAKKLDLDHGVKIRGDKTLDVVEASARVLADKTVRDLKKLSLDELVKAVLGDGFEVERPKGNNSRNFFRQDPPFLGDVHVKFSVLDAYFLYLLGNELLGNGLPRRVSIANPSSYLSKKMKAVKKTKEEKKKTTTKEEFIHGRSCEYREVIDH